MTTTNNSANKTALLLILDGFGSREASEQNAIKNAQTRNIDRLMATVPHTEVATSGMSVGLPEGQMGNSEVGHMTLGTGRIVYQNISRINKAISDDTLIDNEAYLSAVKKAKTNNSAVHIIGLLSPGGVHSHQDHIFAMIEMAKRLGAPSIVVHPILDGRDTPPRSAKNYLEALESVCSKNGAVVASLIGRFYAMDRDQRFDRVEKAYRLFTQGVGETATDSLKALDAAYLRDENDEFVSATKIEGTPNIQDNDAVIFMNFRADRARELTQSFVDDNFDSFDRGPKLSLASFVMTTEYADTLAAECAFKPISLTNGLGETLAKANKTQLRIAETEKYAHVTFFFSGGQEDTFQGEERTLIPSPDVETYDLKPEMSAFEVTEQLVDAINQGKYDCIICNLANGDMVGHTGSYDAAVKAVEALDTCVGKITQAITANEGECLITADHGNCELMFDEENQQPHTQHTTGPVPLIYVGGRQAHFKKTGRLSDIAPTLLSLMQMDIPEEMTGETLLAFD
ncbi:MAG: 2,3-bisphosphoglycerate-independent phosphoglycerate mutase [Cellvibrionales bacterium]|nr:2,3-bisphosphoglycerate-independent phosphoglycerate mutase [Cellvibrionales bacterium]